MDYQRYPMLSQMAQGKIPAELVFKNANVLNVFTGEILAGDIAVADGIIVGVGQYHGQQEIDLQGQFVAPGFIDAHLHMESTLVTPSRLVENALRCGTTTYIVDPHEATNVKGSAGIDFMLADTEHVPANVYFMLPSCVPATSFELAGCVYTAEEMQKHLHHPRVLGLGEVMDYVSVLAGEQTMMGKLDLMQHRIADGHAPHLTDAELSAYALAGIATDHEAVSFENAMRERRLGMHIHIREGSAAHNLEPIVKGMVAHGIGAEGFSFCTDDKHIDDIRREGHISTCIRKAIALGLPMVQAYQMATIQSSRVYGLRHLGAIAPGYQADLVILRDLETVDITAVYHKGKDTANFKAHAPHLPADSPLRNTVHIQPVRKEQLQLPARDSAQSVIEIVPHQILTKHLHTYIPSEQGMFVPKDGFCKLVSIERHHATGHMAVAPLYGFGFTGGAIASSVGHDSHNLLVAGDDDDAILQAIEELVKVGGGYCVVSQDETMVLPLPILGLVSDRSYEEVESQLHRMLEKAYAMGVPRHFDPFLTLSFLALPVIPELRLTPKGLFDVCTFSFIKE